MSNKRVPQEYERDPAMAAAATPVRKKPSVSGDQALKIAAADAERVYRHLSNCRIILSLEDDGWHIDYRLKSPTAVGGGPHYVIDCNTGAIV